MIKLFTVIEADAEGAAFDWDGGVGSFVGWGTWGSGTSKLQMSPDGGTTWIDVGTDVTLTDDGMGNFQLGPCKIRGDLSGSTGATLSAWVL